MMDSQKRQTTEIKRRDSLITEPERQLGGPESGLPPPFIIGADVAPHFIVGLDFGRQSLRAATFSHSDRKPVTLMPKNLDGVVAAKRAGLPYATVPARHYHFWNPRSMLGTDDVLELDNGTYNGTYLTAVLLQKAKWELEKHNQRLLAKAVISIPASFNHLQRSQLMKAGEMAGIRVLALINQSTAAALASFFESNAQPSGPFLVVSIGASECEVSVVHFHEKLLEVRAICSSDEIGGDRIYDSMRDVLLGVAKSKPPYTVEEESLLWDAMRTIRSRMMGESQEPDTFLTSFSGQEITVGMATEMMAPITSKLNKLLFQAISDSQFREDQFAGLIVSGQAGKSWPVLPWLRKRFKAWNISINGSNDVSHGAAIYAAVVAGQNRDWVIWEALGSSLFMSFNGKDKRLFPANSPLPLTAHVQLLAKEVRVESIEFTQQPNGMDRSTIVGKAKVSDVPKYKDKRKKVELSVHIDSDGLMTHSCRDAYLELTLPMYSLLTEQEPGILPAEPVQAQSDSPNPIRYVETEQPAQGRGAQSTCRVSRTIDESSVETPFGKFQPGVMLDAGFTEGSIIRKIEPIVIASTNDLQLYDVVSCIKRKATESPTVYPLQGEFMQEFVFEVVRGPGLKEVVLPCIIPTLSWKQLDLDARLDLVRKQGNPRKIIAQLIQNGSFEAYYSEKPNPMRARQLFEDALLMSYAPKLKGDVFAVIALSEMCGCLMSQYDLDQKFVKAQIRYCVSELQEFVLNSPIMRSEVPYYVLQTAKILGQSKIRGYFRADIVKLLNLLVMISRDMTLPEQVKQEYRTALESQTFSGKD